MGTALIKSGAAFMLLFSILHFDNSFLMTHIEIALGVELFVTGGPIGTCLTVDKYELCGGVELQLLGISSYSG